MRGGGCEYGYHTVCYITYKKSGEVIDCGCSTVDGGEFQDVDEDKYIEISKNIIFHKCITTSIDFVEADSMYYPDFENPIYKDESEYLIFNETGDITKEEHIPFDNENVEFYLKQIREDYKFVNESISDLKLKVVKLSNKETITIYFIDDLVQKLNLVVDLENEKTNYEMYFSNNELFFVLEIIKEPINQLNRYYFYDKQLINWLKGHEKENINYNSEKFENKNSELIKFTEKYLKIALKNIKN